MPKVLDPREDILKYLRKHGLVKKWRKAKELFESNVETLVLRARSEIKGFAIKVTHCYIQG
jgi:hypothetical protein